MGDYVISCCSTADLTQEHFLERNIHTVCFHFFMDGKHYTDDFGKTMPYDVFYQAMADGVDTKTAQVNEDEFYDYFDSILSQGKDILHVSLSSGLTGVINSAFLAKERLHEKYPERRIKIVDSLGASSGYGLMMDKLADLRDEGKTLDELYAWIEENKLRMHHWFFSMDLSFYVKGGRISKAAGWFGTALHICPLLNMDNLGRLTPRYKIRGKKKVFAATVDKMAELAEDRLNYSGKCYMCHSACIEDAKEVARMIEERFPKLNGPVEIYNIGTTIGSHTGPGTVSIFFWGDKREN